MRKGTLAARRSKDGVKQSSCLKTTSKISGTNHGAKPAGQSYSGYICDSSVDRLSALAAQKHLVGWVRGERRGADGTSVHPMNMRGTRRATGDCETAKAAVREEPSWYRSLPFLVLLLAANLSFESCMSEPFACTILIPLTGHVCPRVRHVRSPHSITHFLAFRKRCKYASTNQFMYG